MEDTDTGDGLPPAMREDLREVIRDELRAERSRQAAPEPLLTKDQAADVLNVSLRTVDTLIASGELSSVKVSRCRRIAPAALRAYLRRQAQGGGER